ncbi:precorrin-6A reductase [Desulfoscipio gibsoniae]|uniref:Cobalt-precorrin 6A reductase n=1 Tax=Desulfoscipio gibsoniae DSM 7213 TaxID=767817 RepID=R4KE66_9FIRM|nr:precorrin-6A reductase [Desulfoscipio gibsoniae]AGL01463.1 cobalt-precorrin 6A reductase [Desulfoscipio gibsoniae DSM 7213]
MILVLGGTSESRQLVTRLAGPGQPLIVCTATPYGGDLLKECRGNAQIITGRLNEDELAGLMVAQNITVLIDMTHPFAELATATAQRACARSGVLYLRFERPSLPLPDHPLVVQVNTYQAAARRAVELASQTVFITTGTKTLPLFAGAAHAAGLRAVARILPDPAGLRLCLDLGIAPEDIVAMQGPFSVDMNKALLTHYKASVLVTKESGPAGGSDTKIKAALDLSIPVVVIKRPPAPAGAISDLDELINQIKITMRQ